MLIIIKSARINYIEERIDNEMRTGRVYYISFIYK